MNNFIFNPRRYEERYFWTFQEILNAGTPKVSYLMTYEDIEDFVRSMVASGYTSPIWDSTGDGSIKVEYRGVLDLVVKRFLGHYCFYTTNEDYPTNQAFNFMGKLIMVLEMTSPRYLKLLEVYETTKNQLLDPVEITTGGITRFNDTPQDEGDFANDSHTTNLTEDSRTTSNDLDTKMGRIKEIESSYNNVLLNWSNEFESIFLEENNI